MARSPRIPGFSSDAARARFLAVYDRVLQRLWPVPVRAEDIATSAGTVRIYRAGPNGEDPYVLLTMLGGNALAWHRWMGRFGDRSVIAVDPFGEPDHSVQTRPVNSREGAAGWVEELLAGIGAQRAHLVGASWGGYLAVEHELRHPGRVAAITLVEPAGLRTLPWRFWVWLVLSGLALLLPAPLRRWAARRLPNATLAEDELLRVLRASLRYRRPDNQTVVFTDQELAGVRVPVQALFGSRSPLQAVGVDRLRAAVPGWRVEVIPGAGHTLVMDAEDQVIERVLAFPSPAPTGEGS